MPRDTLSSPEQPSTAANSWSAIAKLLTSDLPLACFAILVILSTISICQWDSAAVPALLIIQLAGASVLYWGHFRHRHALAWMDAPAVSLVHSQVLRHFAFGALVVTFLSSITEGALLVAWLVGLTYLTGQAQADPSAVLTADTPSTAQPISASLIASLAFLAFVVAGGVEEAGKAWAVRCHCRRACSRSQAPTEGQQGATAPQRGAGQSPRGPGAPPPPSRPLRPQPIAQRLPTDCAVLQPRPHVPRVTVALFIAVAAGFSTAENMAYVFGDRIAQASSDAPSSSTALWSAPHLAPSPLANGLWRQLQAPQTPTAASAAPPPPTASWGDRCLGMVLFAGSRALLSLPLHVMCAMLSAFAFLEVDVAVDALTLAGQDTAAFSGPWPWLRRMWPAIALHGTFDFLLMVGAAVMPGRVGELTSLLVSLAIACVMVVLGIALIRWRWRSVKAIVQGFEQAVPASAGSAGQGEYASLLTAAATADAAEEEDDVEASPTVDIELAGQHGGLPRGEPPASPAS